MKPSFALVRERCRISHKTDGQTWMEIVYALSEKPPEGARKVLVPALEQALESQNLRLFALDLFDEFVRLHLPQETSAYVVESALEHALQTLEPKSDREAGSDEDRQLGRYFDESSR